MQCWKWFPDITEISAHLEGLNGLVQSRVAVFEQFIDFTLPKELSDLVAILLNLNKCVYLVQSARRNYFSMRSLWYEC